MDDICHSGAGMIVPLDRAPMSFHESGEPTGDVSLSALFVVNEADTIQNIALHLCRGYVPGGRKICSCRDKERRRESHKSALSSQKRKTEADGFISPSLSMILTACGNAYTTKEGIHMVPVNTLRAERFPFQWCDRKFYINFLTCCKIMYVKVNELEKNSFRL